MFWTCLNILALILLQLALIGESIKMGKLVAKFRMIPIEYQPEDELVKQVRACKKLWCQIAETLVCIAISIFLLTWEGGK